jgi:phosphate transport system permease protein
MSKPQRIQNIVFFFLGIAALLVVLPVILVFLIIFINGVSVLNWEFLFTMPRDGMRAGGIFPAIVGTISLVLGAGIFAIPLSIMAAIYLVEYAQDNWLRRIVEISIVNLSGVPSIVFGLFGFGLFVMFLKFGASILAGSLTLAIMILPVIITASREALKSVPFSFREVSLSLGATRWQTIRHIVLPNAISGILTGTILGLSRAAGETAPILFTAAAFYLPYLPRSVYDQVMALPYHVYVLSTQVPNVSLEIQYGTVLVLVLLILLFNITAAIIRARFRKRKTW